jgi:anthranilate synthase/aminodeoxychorismate synthase-like glutamine amidotransferase
MARARTLLVDNYDSFTFNLVQALGALGADLDVVLNDRLDLSAIERWGPDRIVLGPGPGNPWTERDVGRMPALLRRFAGRVPILGVCMGHQVLARWLGASVVRAGRIMHGKTSQVHLRPDVLFAGMPRSFVAMRYHSWTVRQDSLPAQVQPLAWAEDGTLMALTVSHLGLWGVQFHPESIGTPRGPELLSNFLWRAEVRCRPGRDVLHLHR